MSMNVAFAAFCKSKDEINYLHHLTRASLSYLSERFPGQRERQKTLLKGQYALFNLDNMPHVWKVPMWVSSGNVNVSTTAPAVSQADYVSLNNYEDYLISNTENYSTLDKFMPAYMGTRFDGNKLIIWSDPIGLGRCYYVENDKFFACSNHIGSLSFFLQSIEADDQAWHLASGLTWMVGDRSPIKGIRRMGPGQFVSIQPGRVTWQRYFNICSEIAGAQGGPNYERCAAEIGRTLKNFSQIMVKPPTLYLSGGRDSRLTAAAWIASGEPAEAITLGTIEEEAQTAGSLVERLKQSRGENVSITHRVNKPVAGISKQHLAERCRGLLSVYDGDYCASSLARDFAANYIGGVSIHGGGGEIAQAVYYASESAQKLTLAESHPIFRIEKYYLQMAVTEDARAACRDYLETFSRNATQYLPDQLQQLDLFYLLERFRRWTGVGHQTNGIAIFGASEMIKTAFAANVDDRRASKVHTQMIGAFVPEWRDLPYFSVTHQHGQQVNRQQLRIWQTNETKEEWLAGIVDGKYYAQFWRREKVLELALNAFRDKASSADEYLFQRVLHFEAFRQHLQDLRARLLSTQSAFGKIVSAEPQPLLRNYDEAEKAWNEGRYEQAVRSLTELIKTEQSPSIQYRLGTAYYHGLGTNVSLEQAWNLMSNSSLDDWRYALYYRGLILSNERFSKADIGEAISNLKQALSKGVVDAGKKLNEIMMGAIK